ncbi:kinase-like domain-containing protein [Gigaspora rosea]|uniref:Kinase-like domain-containing protein n=1 Tax=Gigaspora rosea TaxID=44941 RepID=A0A397UGI6_9GLOM|nr:kinase-like domain-containing protein [Gigaspora rosea]
MNNEESSPNTNNNLSSAGFSQNQSNSNLPIEWYIDFTNNNLFMELNADFTNYQINTSSLKNDENQINTQDQTNTSLLNIHNEGITQNYEEKINTLQQQYNAELVRSKIIQRCKKCNYRKAHYDENSNQCKDCYRASLRALSGNKLIDDFIESTQTFYGKCNSSKLEFIPYKQFINIEYLAKGGFSVVYKATWVDGPISRWNPKKQKYNRKGNYDVVLKILNNSEKIDSNYLNELKNFYHCRKDGNYYRAPDALHQYLGITQHSETKNHIIVIEFAQNRDLRYFLNKNANILSCGNILISERDKPTIADLGISKPVNESSDNNSIYGVIPYVPPEVLKGGKFTQDSDIYSFGMIIWEVISGCRPFSDRKHDEYLILDILDGLRPKIPINIPQDLIELMETCWHQDPKQRIFPTSYRKTLKMNDLGYELEKLIRKVEIGEVKFLENKDINSLSTKINDQAIYSSRPLNPLIIKALQISSRDIMRQLNNNQTDDDSKAIYLDINSPYIKS